MEDKAIIGTYLCILPALGLSGFIPLNEFLTNIGYDFLLSKWLLIPIFFILALYVAGYIFHITQYTDEFLPFQLCLLAIIICLLGFWLTPQLLILGIITLIVSAYWSRSTMYQYFRQV